MQKKNISIDYGIVIILFLFFVISLIAVYSGSGQYAQTEPFFFVLRQVVWYVVGILVMIGAAYFDYELLERWALPLYLSGIFLLVLVHFFGTTKNGSQRWIHLGVFDLQPSEFVKIFLILYLAVLLKKYGKSQLDLKASLVLTGKILLVTMVPFVFVFIQPDLGSSLIILVIALTLIIVSHISYKVILMLITAFGACLAFLVFTFTYLNNVFEKLLKPHQLERIYGWLNPGEYASNFGYQLYQARMGIGSGQLTGNGFNQGQQVQQGKIPEAHTDFIFAVIGEEFGFLGASILVLLYFLLIYRIIRVAFQSETFFGVYICVGVVALIAFQVFQNIGMTIGVMPITGITLPLVSYGGSALLTNMLAIGIVFSVQIRSSKEYLFREKAL
ncbi:rod shape-determining protein RodA [Oceanobacillus kimchii]|uniref:Rod shape-determining protein RodA n=1 Tax=Oceanobacillus kimchii TaxID=746691 RepID=A0ABQ5THJ4_9BACI|nr:rod shape-determining protein RodA [Oceanobacillus kimchii]GLO65731.1 rod shape-determining protein RodA [Oceanobacillus kimchii]